MTYFGRPLTEVPPKDKLKLTQVPTIFHDPTPIPPATVRDMSTGKEHPIRRAPTSKTEKL